MKRIIIILGILVALAQSGLAKDMNIYPEVSAKILSIIKVNETVKKGDILVRLDSRQITQQIVQQKAIVALNKIILDDAKKNLDESITLYESTVAPQREVDDATLVVAKLKYKYESEIAKLKYLELEKEKYTIHSPVKGKVKKIVSYRNVTNIKQPKIILILDVK